MTFNVASSTTQNSLTLTGSTGVTAALGPRDGTTQGTGSVSTPDPTRTSLAADYNNVLPRSTRWRPMPPTTASTCCDGDNLKVVFNETGTELADDHRA